MKNILLIQTAFPGDAVLTLPLIQEIAKTNPDSKIDVIAIPSTGSIFESSPDVNEVFILDKRGEHKSLLSVIRFSFQLRKKYDKIFSPHKSFRSSLIVLFSGCKDTIGFDRASMSFIYKTKVKYDKNSHEVRRNLSLLKEFNGDWKINPVIQVRNKSEKLIKFIKDLVGKKVIAIAPGSVWETKKYPEEHFLKIAEWFSKKDFQILFVGGPQEKDLCDLLTTRIEKNAINIAGEFSIPESVEIFKNCDLVISNDSAPTHMAVAAVTNIITIYCSTIPDFGFYPYTNKSIIISDNSLKCKPCGIHGHKSCPEKHFDCGNKLAPEIIIKKVESLKL